MKHKKASMAKVQSKMQTVDRAVQLARKNELKKRYKKSQLASRVGIPLTGYLEKMNDSADVAPGSRLDDYWQKHLIRLFADKFFDSSKLPKGFKPYDVKSVVNLFALRGIQFGNWLSQEDRYNYLYATAVSLNDMKQALDIPYNMLGFKGSLTIGLGSRGKGKAVAHYEPWSASINMTRYHNLPKVSRSESKLFAMLNTGGIGALSHEWAHALDNYLAKAYRYNPGANKGQYVSDGRSIRYKLSEENIKAGGPVKAMELLLATLLVQKNGKPTPFREKIEAIIEKNPDMGHYFARRTEVFARTFEAWLALQLKTKGFRNKFLTQTKYDPIVYPSENQLRKIDRYMRELIRFAR